MITVHIQELIVDFLFDWPLLAPCLYVFIKIITTIFPIIPGLAVNLAGIFSFGWFFAYIYSTIGIFLGGMTIFFVMRRFSGFFIHRFKFLEKARRYEDALSNSQRFWSLILLRIPAALTFDYLSYAAGLTKVNVWSFAVSLLLVEALVNLPIFAVGRLAIEHGLVAVVLIGLAIIGAWQVLRRRR